MNERTARFLDGIASVETSGYSREDSYYAEGVLNDNGERAYGRYQFLPSTYREFSEKAGLLNEDGSLDWSPDTQDAVAAYWAEDLLSRYDANHAARAWLGGEGNVYNDGAADANDCSRLWCKSSCIYGGRTIPINCTWFCTSRHNVS